MKRAGNALLYRNALRVVKGNPSLVGGIQRRMSNLCPRPAGQETPCTTSSTAPLLDNGRSALSRIPPWIPGGATAAATAALQEAAPSLADGTVLPASGSALGQPPAQEAAQEQSRVAQSGLTTASKAHSDRSSSPDSRSSGSTQSSDSSDSRSSASRSSSR